VAAGRQRRQSSGGSAAAVRRRWAIRRRRRQREGGRGSAVEALDAGKIMSFSILGEEREGFQIPEGRAYVKILYQAYDLLKKNESAHLSTCRQISNLSIFPAKTKNRQMSRQADSRFLEFGLAKVSKGVMQERESLVSHPCEMRDSCKKWSVKSREKYHCETM
jgi:hypothetical protein